MKKFLLALGFVAAITVSNAQLYEVPMNQRIQNSSLVVEGIVLSKYSTWDNLNHNIYTINEIEVSKVFKGQISTSTVKVMTYGGIVGTNMERVSNSLQLNVGDVGMFTLKTTNKPISVTGTLYEPYADLQGCLKYNKYNYSAKGPFESYANVDNDLYPALEQATGITYTEKSTLNWKIKAPGSLKKKFGAKSIVSFNPTTVTAGTGTQITITGTGFGSTQGTVGFSDANDGGASFFECLGTQIISWTNTQIVVEVPDRAGTGPIQVVDAGSGTHTSSGNLNVSWAELNVEYDPINAFPNDTVKYAYSTQHIDDDGNGGYTWQYFTDFAANTNAVSSFERALTTWTDTTCINWTIGSTTTTDVIASDGINVVRFDISSELPNGVLGRCTSRYGGCFGSGVNMTWYVSELDIVFDDGTTWEFGTALPSFSEYDFESVAVHELGHGHQLGHVINTNMVMHYAISNGEANRELANDEIDGGLNVMGRSTTTTACSNSLMTEHASCAATCTDPDVPTLGLTDASICNGESTSLTITGNLNDATTWEIYTVSCGGTSAGSTSGSSLSVSPTTTTTYFVRGEGGCVTPGSCASITLTVNELPDVSNTSSTGETCTGNDGTATVNPTGAGGSYSYAWDASTGNQTSQTATGLASGSYDVVVTGANTCSSNTTVLVDDDCTIPTTSLKPAFCGSSPSMIDYLLIFPVSGATDYEYRITNTTTLAQVTFFRGSSSTNFRAVWIPNVAYATTYNIEVRAHVGGNVANFGPVCQITTPVEPTSNLLPAYCGMTASSLNDYIYAQGVAGSQDYRYRFTEQGGTDILIYTRGFNSTQLRLEWVPGIKYGTTYDVEVAVQFGGVFGSFGTICTVTTPSIPTTNLKPAYCGYSASSLNDYIYSVGVAAAEGYQYVFTEQSGTDVLTYVRNINSTQLRLEWVTGIKYNTTYDVQVAPIIQGTPGTLGATCTVTTPAFPTTQLNGSSCNITVSTLNQTLYAVQVPGATGYQYEFAPQGGGTTLNFTKNQPQTSMQPYQVTGIQYGVTYDVRVRAIVSGVTGTYGNICTITTPVSAMPVSSQIFASENNEQNDLSLTVENPTKMITLSPNPSNGNYMQIDYRGDQNILGIEVFDMTGKKVSFSATSGISTGYVEFSETLTNGIYIVRVRFEDNTFSTQKLMVKN